MNSYNPIVGLLAMDSHFRKVNSLRVRPNYNFSNRINTDVHLLFAMGYSIKNFAPLLLLPFVMNAQE